MSKLVVHRSALDAWGAHLAKWKGCTDCVLHQSASQKVFCRGVLPAQILFLGEAPGSGEDDTGYPFVGECGTVLDDIIRDSVGAFNIRIKLELSGTTPPSYYIQRHLAWCKLKKVAPNANLRYCIANAVLCRPPIDYSDNNKQLPPEKVHIQACSKRLAELIAICKPKLIVTVGKAADSAFLSVLHHLPKMIRTLSIYHPGYMLRREDINLEKDRASTAITSGLYNVFNPGTAPPPVGEDEVPF